MTYPKKTERNHVFTANNYYLCGDIDEDGNFRIIATLPIVGNEDLIDKLRHETATGNLKSINTLASTSWLVAKSNVEGDALIGTFLILKEYATIQDQEDWIYWLSQENPTPKEVNEALIRFVKMKQERGEMPTVEVEK